MKSCFGDYMGDSCEGHHDCEFSGKCFSETSVQKGECDCKYKRSCHLVRQSLQAMFKREDPDHVCSFIKYFEEDKNERV